MRVTVSDTGPGIPAQELRTIFRQFYRLGGASADEDGTGLGLAIVKNIINLHDGFVDVKSSEGQGAAFSFNLPKELRFDLRPEPWCGEPHLQKQLRHILRLSLRMIAEMMEAKQVTLLLLNPENQTIGTRAVLGEVPAWAVTETALAESEITVQALQHGKPLFAGVGESVAADSSPPRPSAAERQWAVAPLSFDGANHGLVWVGQKVDGEQFDTDDLDLLGVVCGRVAAVLSAVKQHTASPRMLNRVVDALQTLAMLKQTAIPTATPLALRLLARTAVGLGMSRAEVKRLQYVASLHDAGMARVDEDIRLKAGLLSEEERDEVIQHPEQGVRLLEPLLPVPEMGEIILAHHERMDGSGYPDGRQGGEIPLGARILAVLDTFFAMNNNRPYREGRLVGEIAREIRGLAGTQFDPEVVDMFLAVLADEGILTGDAALPGGVAGTEPRPSDQKEKRCQPQGS
ncbi:MAG: HD domain-containing phosphohydrolase [bacterium]